MVDLMTIQDQGETAPFAVLTFHRDTCPEQLGKFLTQVKTESGSFPSLIAAQRVNA
jgi:hypothetical protein